MNRGKLVIVLIITVALAMSGYAWWYQLQASRRSAEFWGTDAAVLIRYAPQVEFLKLRPQGTSNDPAVESVAIRGVEFEAGAPVDITRSRGMVHARHALVDD